jgi:hypothetical protein
MDNTGGNMIVTIYRMDGSRRHRGKFDVSTPKGLTNAGLEIEDALKVKISPTQGVEAWCQERPFWACNSRGKGYGGLSFLEAVEALPAYEVFKGWEVKVT